MKKPAPLSHGAGEMDENTSSTVRVLDRSEPKQRTWRPLGPLHQALCAGAVTRIEQLGVSLNWCDDAAGLQDGFTAKLLSPNAPNGRGGTIESWDLLFTALDTALHGKRFDVDIVTVGGAGTSMRAAPRSADPNAVARQILHWRYSKFYRAIGAKGGHALADKYDIETRKRWARKAARARWAKSKERKS